MSTGSENVHNFTECSELTKCSQAQKILTSHRCSQGRKMFTTPQNVNTTSENFTSSENIHNFKNVVFTCLENINKFQKCSQAQNSTSQNISENVHNFQKCSEAQKKFTSLENVPNFTKRSRTKMFKHQQNLSSLACIC